MSNDRKKVALGLDENGNLNNDHFGHSAVYAIYLEDGFLIEERENPLYAEHSHAKAEDVRKVIPECAVWAGKSMGKKSREYLESEGIRTLILSAESRKDALDEIVCFLLEKT